MNYSPKLKKVIAQIEQIMIENDIAGIVTLHTASKSGDQVVGFSEYLVHTSPTYSVLNVTPDMARIKITAEDVKKDKEGVEFKMAATYNMISHLADSGMAASLQCAEMSEYVKKILGCEENSKTIHSTHREQNN